MAKEQDRFSEGSENPRGCGQPKRVKLSTDTAYFAKQIIKTVMMLNNRNMYISILEINGGSIITMLNKLPYMSNSRHLKRMDVQITIKVLKFKYKPEITSMFRNNKHNGIETSTTRRQFCCSLASSLSTSFWIMG